MFEFHISRSARQKYGFDESLFMSDGRMIFAGASDSPGSGFEAARRLAGRIFDVSGLLVPASDLYAAGLIDEILHLIIRRYEVDDPAIMADALRLLESNLGPRLDEALLSFTDAFPPVTVYQNRMTAEAHLAAAGAPETTLEEMLLQDLANDNPALEPYKELIDDSALRGAGGSYENSLRLLADFLARRPGSGRR